MTERLGNAVPEEKNESVYDERRVMEIRLSAWMKDPGESAEPLLPPAEHLFKTLPENGVSVYDGELTSPEEITRITQRYLELRSDTANTRMYSVFLGGAAIVVLPLMLFWAYWILDLLYIGNVGSFLALFALISYAICGWQFWNALVSMYYAYKDEPIRFHRKSGKIYRFIPARMGVFGAEMHGKGAPTIREYEWSHVRAEVTKITMFLGRIFQTVTYLQLAVVDPATGQVTERFRVGFRDGLAGLVQPLLLWESIRRYMEEGPEGIAVERLKTNRLTLSDYLDDHNPLSLPERKLPGIQGFFGYVTSLIMWVLSPLMIFMAVLEWIGARTGRTPNWGELEETAFKLDPDDPAAQRTQDPEIEAPKMWVAEKQRRKKALTLWFGSLSLQWLVVAALLHIWPFCSCYYPDGYCIPLSATCQVQQYQEGLMPAQPAESLPMAPAEQVTIPEKTVEEIERERHLQSVKEFLADVKRRKEARQSPE